MGFRDNWKRLKSVNLDLLYDFDWEEIKKDPDKREKFAIIIFTAEIIVTFSIVLGMLIFIYLIVFT